MKTFKKLFSVSAIVALLGTLAPMYAFGATYDTELTNAYEYAHAKGITTMSSIDNADMYGNLSRIAMAKMIANFATTVLGLEPDTSAKCTFTDVTASLDAQYDNGVTNACQLGLMGQNITAFRPNDPVTRGEFGTTLSRALNANSDDLAAMNAADPFYKEHLNFLKEEGIMNNISNPNQVEVRGYVMLMMMRADDSYTPATAGCSAEELLACITADDYDACIAACSDEAEEEEEELGNAEVTVSGKAATSQDVALNAVNKKIGTITLKASKDSDAVVSTVVVNHSGLGDARTVQLQLYNNSKSVSTKKAMGSNNNVTLKLSPALTIKAGSSITLDVMASMMNTAKANDTHSFAVESVNVANGKATGTPVSLGTIKTTSYTVGSTKVALTKKNDITAGDNQKALVSVKVTPTTKSVIDGFTLSINDKLADNTTDSSDIDMNEAFDNVKAYINNKEVGTVTVNEDAIVVSNLNIAKNSNESVTVDLKVDGIYVGAAGTLGLAVLANDVAAVESSTDENMSSALSNVVDIDLESVDLKITKLTKEAKNYAPGTNGVVLFNAKVTSDVDFEITDYDIDITPAEYCTTSPVATKANCEKSHCLKDSDSSVINAADQATCEGTAGQTWYETGVWGFFPIFDKVTVYVDGVDTEITDAAAAKVSFGTDDSFSVGGKTSAIVKVEGDVKSELPAYILNNPKTYALTLNINKVKNPETDKVITLSVNGTPTPKSRLGDSVKIMNGTYTVQNPTDMPVTKTILQGTESNVAYFDVKTKSEDGILNSVTVSLDTTATTTTNDQFDDFATEITLMKGDTEIKTIDAGLNTATLTFADLSESLVEDQSVSFTVKATLKSDAELANSIKVDVATTVVKNNAGITLTPAALLPGKTYQIVKTMPTVTLTKDGEYIKVNVVNNADVDIQLLTLNAKVTNNVIGNEGGTVSWKVENAGLSVLDGKGGTSIGTAAGPVPGTLALSSLTKTVAANSSAEFVVEMDAPVTLSSDYYEVTKKSISFKFSDGNGGRTTAVSENY